VSLRAELGTQTTRERVETHRRLLPVDPRPSEASSTDELSVAFARTQPSQSRFVVESVADGGSDSTNRPNTSGPTHRTDPSQTLKNSVLRQTVRRRRVELLSPHILSAIRDTRVVIELVATGASPPPASSPPTRRGRLRLRDHAAGWQLGQDKNLARHAEPVARGMWATDQSWTGPLQTSAQS
jgi:hypothetical protein